MSCCYTRPTSRCCRIGISNRESRARTSTHSTMTATDASRRRFLQAAAGVAGSWMVSTPPSEAAIPTDLPRELKPTAANLGTLFPDVQKLAADNRYTYSFLGDRFKTLEEFKKAG